VGGIFGEGKTQTLIVFWRGLVCVFECGINVILHWMLLRWA
jgi:hypothetical protein